MNYEYNRFEDKDAKTINNKTMAEEQKTIAGQMAQGALTSGLDLAGGLIGSTIGAGVQRRQQEKLNKFNQGLALDFWKKTNYSAQREQLEKAGLNVGLMYKGAGEGGQTVQPGGQVQSIGNQGMGMLMASQIRANVQLAEAQANLANTQANKIGKGDPTETGTERGLLGQQITNEATRGAILELEKGMKDTEAYLQRMTVDEALDKIRNESARVKEQLDMDKRSNRLQEETYNEAVKKIKNDVTEGVSRIAMLKAGVSKAESEMAVNQQTMTKMKAEIINMDVTQMQNWARLSQSERETQVKQMVGEQATNTPEKIRQWTTIATDIIRTVAGAIK